MLIKKLTGFTVIWKSFLFVLALLTSHAWAAQQPKATINLKELHQSRLLNGANPVAHQYLKEKVSGALSAAWLLFSSQSIEFKVAEVIAGLIIATAYQNGYLQRPFSWYLYTRDWVTMPDYESRRAALLAEVEASFQGQEDKRKLAVLLVNAMPEEDLMVVSATFLALNVETKTDLYCTYIGKPYTDGFCDLEQLSADFYLHVLPYRSGSESLAKLQTELTTRLSGQSPKAKTYEDFCNNSRWMGRPCAVFWSPWSNYKYSEALNGEDRLYFTVLKMAAEIKAAMVLRYDFFLLANSPRLVSAQTSSFEKADIEEKVGKNAVSVLKKTVKPSNKTKAGPLTVKELSQLPVVYTRDRDFGERSRWTHAFNHFEKAELSLLDVHDEESYLCANQVPLYRIPANTQTLSIPLQERQLYRGASPLYGYEPCGSAGNLIEFVSYEEGAFRVEMHLNLNL